MQLSTDLISEIPQEAHRRIDEYWQRYLETCQIHDFPLVSTLMQPKLFTAWVGSDFVAEWCIKNPTELHTLLNSVDLQKTRSFAEYISRLQKIPIENENEEQLMESLRLFRQQEMVRIAWRDLSEGAKLTDVLSELSSLAEAIIQFTLQHLYQWHCEKWGIPRNDSGKQQYLSVIALGKLGGHELNFSSDVDLMFAYPEAGSAHQITNDVFFTRLAQQLIKVLQTQTAQGIVYRVDMRLRPFGDAGPLVMNFASLLNYYQEQGREWERYALIKARVICGSAENKTMLQSLLNPFVYRRYVDYTVFDTLRDMKVLFEREERLKNLTEDIKRGSGGIRQIEFITQTFQLVRGGQDPMLQHVSLLPSLYHLEACRLLSSADVASLMSAYEFLRRLEHRLQMLNDQQIHLLPQDELSRTRIAFAMNYRDWSSMIQALQQHRDRVAHLFSNMLSQQSSDIQCYQSSEIQILQAIIEGQAIDQKVLRSSSLSIDWIFIQQLVNQFRESYRFRQLNDNAKRRMNQLLLFILQSMLTVENFQITLRRVMILLEAISRRSVYVVLLLENPLARDRLVKLFELSAGIKDLITHFPLLLDELLYKDPARLTLPPSELQAELRQHLLAIPEDDLEQQMETLRSFRQRQHLKIAIADVLHQLPLIKVSDHLTYVAEVILQQVHFMAAKALMVKNIDVPELAIIAYGKLGSYELSYQSDLDLVFLYDENINDERIAIRLAQKIIHLLNTRMTNGVLYSVDTRLRPSGSAGLLVSSFNAFSEYQQQNAWTWEHQALVRARVVSGNKYFFTRFAEMREKILSMKRSNTRLRRQIVEMREKIRQSSTTNLSSFDIKQCEGGITDIEFIVQYGVLAWSWKYPNLLRWTDNIHLLETFASEGLMTEDEVKFLIRAYQIYRDVIHQRVLKDESYQVENQVLIQHYPEAVQKIWHKHIG